MKKQFIILAALALLLIVLSGCGESFATGEVFANSKAVVREAKAGITEISYDDLKLMLEEEKLRVLIDVREAGEFDEGYINMPDEEGEYLYSETFTVNIPRGLLEFKIGDSSYWDDDLWVEMPTKDELIVIYCKAGGRSALAAQTLQIMGYTNVFSLQGGYRIWMDPSLPLEEEASDSGG